MSEYSGWNVIYTDGTKNEEVTVCDYILKDFCGNFSSELFAIRTLDLIGKSQIV